MSNLNTFAGWTEQSRGILRGEKATAYGRLPDDSWIALFSLEQTEERWSKTIEDVLETRTAEEHCSTTKPTPGPKIIVEVEPDGETMKLWVGSNKRALEMVKKSRFRFDPRLHRWIAKRKDPAAIVAELEKRGYTVDYRPAT